MDMKHLRDQLDYKQFLIREKVNDYVIVERPYDIKNLTITNFDRLYEGVPKWAIKEYLAEKNVLNDKSIFTDTEGIWKNLPLEVLGLIMAYHSRNNNRYWGSISFCANLKKNFSRTIWGGLRYDYDYNPYKNVNIYQNTTLYNWRMIDLPDIREVPDCDYDKLAYHRRYQRMVLPTTYGKARANKRRVIKDINQLTDIFESGTGKDSYAGIFPSKMKFKWVKNGLSRYQNALSKYQNEWREYRALEKIIVKVDTEGLTEKEISKGIKKCYYLCYKDHFTIKHGFMKHPKNIIIYKKKIGKREEKASYNWSWLRVKKYPQYICY